MRTRKITLTLLAWSAVAGACTIVTPPGGTAPGPGGGTGPGGGPDPGTTPGSGSGTPVIPPVTAHALFVMNLNQSSANLASYYTRIASSIVGGLAEVGIEVRRWAVTPLYPSSRSEIPPLIYGQGANLDTTSTVTPMGGVGGAGGLINEAGRLGSPTTILQEAAATGFFDGDASMAEDAQIVPLGGAISEARLPPQPGAIDGQDFFDRPPSLFLVVYLQPLARHCGLTDAACLQQGRTAADIFTQVGADGTASWLRYRTGGMPIENIVHVAIATKEGESRQAFQSRCQAVPMFPQNLFDVMEPSPASYYAPLISALNAAQPGTGQTADLCELMGSASEATMRRLVFSIAAMAGAPAN